MGTEVDRYGYASILAVLTAVQAVILSLPLGFYTGLRHASKSEFSGIAVLGQMVVTGAITGAVTLCATFIVVAICYRPESPRYRKLLRTLIASVGTAVVGAVTIGRWGNGILWAIVLSAVVLGGGLVAVALPAANHPE